MYKLIACKVLQREFSRLAADCTKFVDISYLRRGLHDTPEVLRRALQEQIDLVEGGVDLHTNQSPIEAILIGYGLCSNGIQGLHSSKVPLVIPRCHDCISLFLGGKDIYRQYFDSHKGVYWYTRGWMETSAMPDGEMLNRKRSELEQRGFDQDDIEYLLEMENAWVKNYNWLTYVSMPDFDEGEYPARAKKVAVDLGWNYDELKGDMGLLRRMLEGDWDERDFLVVPPGTPGAPGARVEPSFDESIIKAIAE